MRICGSAVHPAALQGIIYSRARANYAAGVGIHFTEKARVEMFELIKVYTFTKSWNCLDWLFCPSPGSSSVK